MNRTRVSVKKVLICFLFFGLFSTVDAGSFTVSNITQFQSALNTAATNGENDTINVLSGIYNVNPTLAYSSNENYFLLIRGISSPVLNGGNLRQIIQLTTTAINGDLFLEGLIIQNGRANYGGGLNVSTQGGDISLNNCTINDNVANYVGGGVNLFSNTGNITITNCSFNRNSSPNTSGFPYGNAGGLFIQTDGAGTTIRMVGCTFGHNTAQRDAAGAMLYPLGSNSTIIAEYNTFNNNIANEAGAGCWIRSPSSNSIVRYRSNTLSSNSSSVAGNGGGTYIQITSGIIDLYDNIFNGNHAASLGGGLWIEHSGGILNIFRNRFSNNTSNEAGGGANVFLNNGSVKVVHNVFYRNRTSGVGGGLNLSTHSGNLNIFNNTFYLNGTSEGGDVYLYFENSSATSNFFNNILYNSSMPALSYSGQQTVIARYSNIKGGIGQPWFGTGCIDLFPFFVDTAGNNLHLQDSIHCGNLRYSPCIDAGVPTVPDSILNCNWGLGIIRSDMGAYGGKYSISIGIKKLNENIPVEYHLEQNYPNPFNLMTTIKFYLPKPSFTILTIYDILGREVETLVNEELKAGCYKVDWDGSNYTSGVYYYKLIADGFVETKKMILTK